MFIENTIYAIITTVILFVVFRFMKLHRQKAIDKNNQIALNYSKTNLSSRSKKILTECQNKKGYITHKTIRDLESNIDKETLEVLMENFKEKQLQVKKTVRRQKFPTCFDHLK